MMPGIQMKILHDNGEHARYARRPRHSRTHNSWNSLFPSFRCSVGVTPNHPALTYSPIAHTERDTNALHFPTVGHAGVTCAAFAPVQRCHACLARVDAQYLSRSSGSERIDLEPDRASLQRHVRTIRLLVNLKTTVARCICRSRPPHGGTGASDTWLTVEN
jgi:hypothetical protein